MTVKAIPKKYLTDDELFEFCLANQDKRVERNADGSLVLREATHFYTSARNSELNRVVANWNHQAKLGIVTDSNGGYVLPNRAMRAPDVAWISNEKLEKLETQGEIKFAHVCPDFVVELQSHTDTVKALKTKMEEYIANGCRLGWLILPKQQKAFIYRADGTVEAFDHFEGALSGEDVLPGLSFDLKTLNNYPATP